MRKTWGVRGALVLMPGVVLAAGAVHRHQAVAPCREHSQTMIRSAHGHVAAARAAFRPDDWQRVYALTTALCIQRERALLAETDYQTSLAPLGTRPEDAELIPLLAQVADLAATPDQKLRAQSLSGRVFHTPRSDALLAEAR